MAGILWAILVVVLVVWLIGLLVGTVGSFIHILLIVAAIILIYNLWSGRRV
ncbi:MAG: lmo0937 family membrane protein [Thermomicrobiales bacterium]